MIGDPKILYGRLQVAKIIGEAPKPQRVKLDELVGTVLTFQRPCDFCTAPTRAS